VFADKNLGMLRLYSLVGLCMDWMLSWEVEFYLTSEILMYGFDGVAWSFIFIGLL